VFYKQMTIRGSICYTTATWDHMMRIYEQRGIRLNDLVSKKLPISEWRTAFDLCRDKKVVKVLLYPE
jgi:L-iditol 2-dehydrogenase